MTIKKLKFINNFLFYGATLFALVVLAKNYIDRARLPEGVCPIDNNSGLIYISIALLVVSFILGIVLTGIEKKNKVVNKLVDKEENKDEEEQGSGLDK